MEADDDDDDDELYFEVRNFCQLWPLLLLSSGVRKPNSVTECMHLILLVVMLHKVLYSCIGCFIISHSTKRNLSVCCDEFYK
jgi:hypothetical protein